jgi:serine/threonine protein kinase
MMMKMMADLFPRYLHHLSIVHRDLKPEASQPVAPLLSRFLRRQPARAREARSMAMRLVCDRRPPRADDAWDSSRIIREGAPKHNTPCARA